MAAALIGSIKKEEEVKITLKLPKSLSEELTIYTHYIGGKDGDESEAIEKMIEYVLDRESKGKQGKKYKEFKDKYLAQKTSVDNDEEDVNNLE